MNSLNILSAHVIGQTPPPKVPAPRSRSLSEGSRTNALSERQPKRSASASVHDKEALLNTLGEKETHTVDDDAVSLGAVEDPTNQLDEKTPLIVEPRLISNSDFKHSKLHIVAKRLVDALAESLKWVLSTLATPGTYVVRCFYDDRGRFSPLVPARKLSRTFFKRNGHGSTAQAVGLSGSSSSTNRTKTSKQNARRKASANTERPQPRSSNSFSSAASDSELENSGSHAKDNLSASRPRTQATSSSEDVTPARRSIRIKLYNEDTARRRKSKRSQGNADAGADSTGSSAIQQPTITISNLKSPTSPTSSLRMTKYPRAPAPPRPLIPRRQPSYSSLTSPLVSTKLGQKTLVIDLDETLIHSLAKGGRMSSGHMVEVKLNTAVGFGGATLGPQHPILYYVHKRPHCDEFLRKVCKWYNLVVFTASVQEYADPVIDWLEQERKYFSGRYYRQHCTFRNGAYIKDLSSVEPDLSKVMILDNSPLSYIFHEGKQSVKHVKEVGLKVIAQTMRSL